MALDYTVIGQRLKKARKNKGFTQEDMAEKLDVSIPYISRVERGRMKINLTRLSQFCHILEIPEGQILNGANITNPLLDSKQFEHILETCSPVKQNLICQIAELIANTKF